MDIRTAAIVGAGAIGSYMIWGLADKLGDGLVIAADGARKERLEREGLIINDRKFELNVRTPAQAKGADLVIVCVKYGSLDSAVDTVAQIADEHTVVLSLLNGIDSEERIGGRIGMEHMIYSVIKIASHHSANAVEFNPPAGRMGIYFGENEANGSTALLDQKEMTQALARLFDGTPLCYHISDCIMQDLWAKFALNVSENLPQAIIGCGMGGYFDSVYVDLVRTRLREEVFALARKNNIEIPPESAMTKVGSSIKKDIRFSTLQDLDARRHTEVDMLAGEAVRLGKEYGIPTPCNEIVYNLIKALEEKNDGKFNY